MNFSISAIFASIVFGIIGIIAFKKGKRQGNVKGLLLGLALLVYPYFTSGPWIDWVIGSVLSAIAYYVS